MTEVKLSPDGRTITGVRSDRVAPARRAEGDRGATEL